MDRPRVAPARTLWGWGCPANHSQKSCTCCRVPRAVKSPAWMRMSPGGIGDTNVDTRLCVSAARGHGSQLRHRNEDPWCHGPDRHTMRTCPSGLGRAESGIGNGSNRYRLASASYAALGSLGSTSVRLVVTGLDMAGEGACGCG